MSKNEVSKRSNKNVGNKTIALTTTFAVIALLVAAGAALTHVNANRQAQAYFERQAEFIASALRNADDPNGLEVAVATPPTLDRVTGGQLLSKQYRNAEAQSLALTIYTDLLQDVFVSYRNESQGESLVQPLADQAHTFRGGINASYFDLLRSVGNRALKIEEDYDSARLAAIEFHSGALAQAHEHKNDIGQLSADNDFMRSRFQHYGEKVDDFIDTHTRALKLAEDATTMGALFRAYAVNDYAHKAATERLHYAIQIVEQGHYGVGFYVRALLRSIDTVPSVEAPSSDEVQLAVMAHLYGDMGREVLSNPPADDTQLAVTHIGLSRYFLEMFADEVEKSQAPKATKEYYADRAEMALDALSLIPDSVIQGRQNGTGTISSRVSALREGAYDIWTTSNYPHPGLDLAPEERMSAWDAVEYDEARQFFEDHARELMPRDELFKDMAKAYVEAMRICIDADLKYIRGLEANFRDTENDTGAADRSKSRVMEIALTHLEESRECRIDVDKEFDSMTASAADSHRLFENAEFRFAELYRGQ